MAMRPAAPEPPRVLLAAPMRPHSLGEYYERGLREIGCPVTVFDLDGAGGGGATQGQGRGTGGLREWLRRKNLAQGRRFTHHWRRLRRLADRSRRRARDAALLAAAADAKPDLLFIIFGLDIDPAVLADITRKTGARLFFFHSEDFLCLPEMHPRPFLQALPLYDCIFTATRENLEEYPRQGARRVEFLPFGFDPVDHRPPALRPEDHAEFGAEVAFVGKWWFERAALLEELVDVCRVAVWGPDWEVLRPGSPLRPFVKGRSVVGPEMARIYAASKICLNNLTRRPNRHGHLMRTFEIAACGGFQLSERSDETLGFFEEGKEIECFAGAGEAREKIRYYLSHDADRRRISEGGRARCWSHGYSYAHRARQVLAVLAGL